MNKKTLIGRLGAAGLAVGLCMAVGVGTTFAYYTDATSAEGSLPYTFASPSTDIDETPEDTNKNIVIENTGDVPVLVRVKLLYAQSNAAVSIGEGTGGGWMHGENGWLYYTEPLWGKGDVTAPLIAAVMPVDGKNSVNEFNVTVIQQCAQLQWSDDEQSYAGLFAGSDTPLAMSSFSQPVKIGDAIDGIGRANVSGLEPEPSKTPEEADQPSTEGEGE